jgi:sulfite reductase alpha subunit-like flavoprotein
MPDDVAGALVSIFESQGGLSREEGKNYLQDMTRTNRFQKETW